MSEAIKPDDLVIVDRRRYKVLWVIAGEVTAVPFEKQDGHRLRFSEDAIEQHFEPVDGPPQVGDIVTMRDDADPEVLGERMNAN